MTDMQKIDFHYNVPDRLRYACLVARTVYRRGAHACRLDGGRAQAPRA